jgi:cell division septal protein FtsQ
MEVTPGRPLGLTWTRLAALVLFVGSVGVLYSLFSNPRFQVTDVTVQGNHLVSSDDIRRTADVEGSIFRVRPDAVSERIRGAFGCIDRVNVTSRLPNHVTITVREREGTLVWESAGRYWWVGPEGSVLGTLDDPGDLVVVRDATDSDTDPEGQVVGPPWRLVGELSRAMPTVRAYDYTREHGLVVYATEEMWPVYLGHEGDAYAKVALMRALVGQLTQQGVRVQYIDVRNERRAAYK